MPQFIGLVILAFVLSAIWENRLVVLQFCLGISFLIFFGWFLIKKVPKIIEKITETPETRLRKRQLDDEIKAKNETEILKASKEHEERKQLQISNTKNLVEFHVHDLVMRKRQLAPIGPYGIQNTDRWEEEKKFFVKNIIRNQIKSPYIGMEDELCIVEEIVLQYEAEILQNSAEELDPLEYEEFCAKVLNEYGWKAGTTKASGDQGADVVAEYKGIVVVLQCKKYSQPVGNKAVQEVFSAKEYYRAKRAVVVSNASYTQSARQLAEIVDVQLIHHSDLPKLKAILDV